MQRSRGTGPRATVKRTVFVSRCSSGSPDPELFVIWRSQTTEGGSSGVHPNAQGGQPPRYGEKNRPPNTVGRGPVPRHVWGHRSVAGDRPPRYSNLGVFIVGRGPEGGWPPCQSPGARNEQDRSRICRICRICKICKMLRRPRSVGRERPLSPVRAQASPNYRWVGERARGPVPRATVKRTAPLTP